MTKTTSKSVVKINAACKYINFPNKNLIYAMNF